MSNAINMKSIEKFVVQWLAARDVDNKVASRQVAANMADALHEQGVSPRQRDTLRFALQIIANEWADREIDHMDPTREELSYYEIDPPVEKQKFLDREDKYY